MSTKTGSGSIIGVGAVVLIGILVAFGLSKTAGDELPPDPMEDDAREVMFEVDWDAELTPKLVIIDYQIGQHRGSHETSNEPWVHITLAVVGDAVRVAAEQSAPGFIICNIYVDGDLVATEAADETGGCFAEATVR